MKGKETSPTLSPAAPAQPPDVGGLSLNSHTGPPRPPAASKPNPPPPMRPPRPVANEPDSEPEDENDPFGDKNVVETPAFEKGEPKW